MLGLGVSVTSTTIILTITPWLQFMRSTNLVSPCYVIFHLYPDPSLPDPGELPNNCKANYVQYYDSCFRVLTTNPSGMTFTQAQTACESDGTSLASIIDTYEQAFVETQLHSMGDNPLWVGLVDDKVRPL